LVAIDRDTTLRKAEKFLRQGRLDNAIAEYLRVVEDQPRDWSTVNTVGDLLVRAGQYESAIEHYTRIADHLFTEGFLPRAAAVYKKILKVKPDQEHALVRTAEIFERQGLIVEAKKALTHIAERRMKRGDRRGASEIQVRIGALDPSDLTAGLAAAKASGDLGQTSAAVEKLVRLAGEFSQRGKLAESLQALDEAVRLEPEHPEARAALVARCIESGDLERATRHAAQAGEFKAIAAELFGRGRDEDGLLVLERALERDPADVDTRAQLVRSHLSKGHVDRARACLSDDVTDPELLLSLAEIELTTGTPERAREVLGRVLQAEPGRRDDLVLLGCRLCEQDREAGFQCVDVATDAAIAEHDWPAAASGLHEYVTRVPGHIPALMKLVEVCVDGGLEATMYTAQAQLADAYLEAGRANEARVIAEDLVAREPWQSANIERFRRALVLLGDPDPDGVIADRLSGDSPFTSSDFVLDFDLNDPGKGLEPEATPAAAPGRPAEAGAGAGAGIDLSAILGVESSGTGDGDAIEIDMSDALAGLDLGRGDQSPARPSELERVFEDFREEASRAGAGDAGGRHLRQAVNDLDAGRLDDAVQAAQKAVRSPRHRFEAAVLLARIQRGRGKTQEAIEWFERAAQAHAPNAAAGRDLLYELGHLLAEAGENARALAVFLELQADAPDYRDVATAIERLTQKSA
jgi:tetratricopeptide (TPR) repeat protein